MNVASLELCKELHETSRWELPTSSEFHWVETADGDQQLWARRYHEIWDEEVGRFPAYDLSYLLRKLPPQIDGIYDLIVSPGITGSWLVCYCEPDGLTQYDQVADTPEDAATMLAIELFKQGLLTRDGDE
jgi:hypothetical protein